MPIIDPIDRVPSWNNKLANDERNRREALADFARAAAAGEKLARQAKFWARVAGVLALVAIALVVRSCVG